MIADYVAATPRKVPGFADLHRMAMLLLAERAPAAAEDPSSWAPAAGSN